MVVLLAQKGIQKTGSALPAIEDQANGLGMHGDAHPKTTIASHPGIGWGISPGETLSNTVFRPGRLRTPTIFSGSQQSANQKPNGQIWALCVG
jgi:hypothetical protein